jgi:tetratricopeptide (TPR) repeat protein
VPIIWLLQPIAQTTGLLYMILLGIAVSSSSERGDSVPSPVRTTFVKPWIWATATVIGLGAASWLMVAEYRLSQAALHLDGDAFAAAEAMYFGDPIVSDVGGRIWIGRSILDPAAEANILPQLEHSADLEPTRAYLQARVAAELARLGEYDAAEERARRALELQPTSALGWSTLSNVAEQTGDEDLRAEASAALCLLGLDDCDSTS